MTKSKPNIIPITQHIQHMLNGGSYMPSREVVALMATDHGQREAQREQMDRSAAAIRHAKRLIKQRQGNSKYMPHQGARERERRARQ